MINFELFGTSPIQAAWAQDFLVSTDLTALTNTAIAAGSASQGTLKNGNIRFTGAATTDVSGANIQLVTERWTPAVGSYGAMEAGITFGSTIVRMAVGLCVVDTSIIASAPTDGFYISKATGATGAYTLEVRGGSATLLSRSLPILANTSLNRLGVEVNYDDFDITKATVNVYSNGSQVLSVAVSGLPSSAPTLVPTCEIQSGSAVGTQTADLDFWVGRHTRS